MKLSLEVILMKKVLGLMIASDDDNDTEFYVKCHDTSKNTLVNLCTVVLPKYIDVSHRFIYELFT